MAAYSDETQGIYPYQLIGLQKSSLKKNLPRAFDEKESCKLPCANILVWHFKSKIFARDEFELAVHLNKNDTVLFARWELKGDDEPIPPYTELDKARK